MQVLLGRGVDAGDRLVEEVQVGLRRERPGEEHAPALAARQRADLGRARGRPCRPARAPPRPRRGRPARAGGTARARG